MPQKYGEMPKQYRRQHMSKFSSLRKKNKSNLEVLKAKTQTKESYDDDRYWQCQRDKADNGFAIIRFLDVSKADLEHFGDSDDAVPWSHYYTHGFKNQQGRWFFDNCPTTLGDTCPVCESNSELWNSGIESDKKIVRERKRKEHYVANIYIVKDTATPENEGKVFLYKFGTKIFEKIKAAMTPEFEDEVGFNPFDFWEGANFKLKVRRVDGYINYDRSEFDSCGPLMEDDDAMEQIWSDAYPLHGIASKDKFTSYAEMKKKLDSIIGVATKAPAEATEQFEDVPEFPVSSESEADDDGDDLDYFRSKLDE